MASRLVPTAVGIQVAAEAENEPGKIFDHSKSGMLAVVKRFSSLQEWHRYPPI